MLNRGFRMVPAYFLVFVALSANLVLLHPVEEECPTFYCGNLGRIRVLYTDIKSECSSLTADACTKPLQMVQLESGGKRYDVISIYSAEWADSYDWWLRPHLQSCNFVNLTSPASPPIYFYTTPNLTLLKCNHTLKITPRPYFSFRGYRNCHVYDSVPLPPQCSIIQLSANNLSSLKATNISLEVQVSADCRMCHYEEGQCQNNDDGKPHCDDAVIVPPPAPHHPPPAPHPPNAGKKPLALKLGLALGTGCLAILTICFFFFLLCCNKQNFLVFGKKETQNHQSVEVFLRNCGSLAPKRYSYSTVKEMTNSFKDKLGQGGYGGVYKGKLHDGHLVAVKVLNKSKGDGEEFINEVASISRTSHVNIVTLLGFCFEGSKRALIYEFVPNGSLEKFIYGNPLWENRQLGWETLYQIAIGIARGLEYLHRGCSTRILHFDIKPHNILLDEDFCPKIADFGLAKLCPKKESIISMQGARGTAGYIAPEVFSRHFGGVSHKSDVYSYGMMILEMVGGRKNIDVGVDHTSEIYFPHWIYKRLHEQGYQLGLHGVMNEEENEKVRKMILVGLWCIQNDPSNRPPISRVVDMLQGSLGSLQIPPKPFLSSPPRSPADSISTHIMTL